ncbi:MAG: mannitol dehydrogenase family protein [Pseudomonadales bacterium]
MTTKRLSQATVHLLNESIEAIPYNRAELKSGIVHLGIGAFHRAHQAVYTDELLRKIGGDWMITGASLRSPSMFEALMPQDCLYTVNVHRSPQTETRLIGAVKNIIYARQDGKELMSQLVSPDTKIVSLTITEKGYYLDAITGGLDFDAPDIIDDLKNPQTPKTAIGYLVEALHLRRGLDRLPFTPLSCDNLPANGKKLKRICLDYARSYDEDLASWIDTHVSFPCTMVDRIVPAPSNEDERDLQELLSLQDKGGLFTEDFCQWVIEDDFVNSRPAWEQVGVVFSQDVGAFEEMKLRLLNGAHSAMAYMGYLSGQEYIAECMSEPSLNNYVTQLLKNEIAPEVNVPAGYDLDDYIEQLLSRFRNANLKHRCYQIAMDGSQKIPIRLLGTISERLAKYEPIDHLALAVAAWMIYVSGFDLNNNAINVQDPMAQVLQSAAKPHRDEPAALVSSLLGIDSIFSKTLSESAPFTLALTTAVREILTAGPIVAIRNIAAKNDDRN